MNTDVTYIAVVAPGELPLEPQLTPGWGVAGAIMLLTGATFTLIGIKNGWLLTFFSSAFLTSLCIAILIVYVMSPPIRDAVQGGYVVAVVIAGLVLGGAATLFRELTEGFGCLLGGFCVSMWFLTLKEGGLLTETTQKIIFIAAFTVGGFAFYFSHYTRGYAQISLTSFSGATVTVLGIDCFTKAGLKEYWAYIWNLNKNLFPLNTTTYPLTKVIRVETALIIIFTALGIISQLKLWRVIQQRRATQAEALAEEQRQRDVEEANVGQQIEEENEREKRQWEATYGDQPPKTPIGSGSGDSGVGDMDHEKKARYSEVTTVPVPGAASTDGENEIEMKDMTSSGSNSPPAPPKQGADGLVVSDQHKDDGRVTVRVASDDGPATTLDESLQPMPEPEEKAWIARTDGEVRPASFTSARNSRELSKPTSPEIVPLPFRVPQFEELAERDPADRSSFATIAEEEDERSIVVNKRLSRASAGNRLSMLSMGSGKIMRSLSGRSDRSQKFKGKSGASASRPESPPHRDSSEGLVAERRASISADSASVAATIDGLSDDDTDKSGGVGVEERGRSIEILAELAERHQAVESSTVGQKISEKPEPEPAEAHSGLGKDNLDLAVTNEPTGTPSKRSSSTNTPAKTTASNAEATEPTEELTESAKNARSAAPSVASSSRASLTKDRLPSGLSRVALSYRTNEWAKHLSQAETPEPENLQLPQHHRPKQEVASVNREEPAAPVNVEELQQTAETSSVPPAPISTMMPRSASSASRAAAAAPQASEPPVYRSSSRATAMNLNPKTASPPSQPTLLTVSPKQIAIANGGAGAPVSPLSPVPSPTGALQASHSFRMKAGGNSRRTSTDVIARPIAEETGDERYATSTDAAAAAAQPEDSTEQQQQQQVPSARPPVPGVVPYASPQTLLGQREMFLRNKSQPMLVTPPIPEHPEHEHHSGSSSEAGSIYNYRSSSMPMPMPAPVPDIDDIPLSQRKEMMMRQNSMLSLTGGGGGSSGNRANSTAMAMHHHHHHNHVPRATPTPTQQQHSQLNAETLPFNSHQPRRRSTAPTPTQRESQLASFRNSVAMDLRAGTPINIPGNGSNLNLINTNNNTNFTGISGGGGGGGGGRETPFLAPNLPQSSIGAAGAAAAAATAKERDGEVRRSIERSRSALLSQKEQEAQRRELELWERERSERAFEEMMRSGNLLDAHREAMRKLQGGVRDA
ncbi:hypothetical protein SLS62_007383 [Diatrype stigma]|uniref:TM7S3/TM198-like domain-containing protein n=1 Tax=Diatrype stigma TaxID=117547 RepID=A0AAN9UZF4_9PEZI